MLTKRRVVAAATAFACALIWVVFLAPGSPSNATVAAGNTVRASVDNEGNLLGSNSTFAATQQAGSANGRFVAFVYGPDSDDHKIAPGPGAGRRCSGCIFNENIYVRDLKDHTTAQVSIGRNIQTGDVEVPNGTSSFPSISADGRYVSFLTFATNIGTSSSNFDEQLVVCDRDANGDGTFAPAPDSGPFTDSRCITVAGVSGASALGEFSSIGDDGWPHLGGGYRDAQGIDHPLRIVWAEDDEFAVVEFRSGAGRSHSQLAAPVDSGQNTYVADLLTSPLDKGTVQSLSSAGIGDQTFDAAWLDQPGISVDGATIVARAHFPEGGEFGILLYQHSPDAAGGWLDPERVDAAPGAGFVGSSDFYVAHPQVSNGGTRVVFDSDDRFAFGTQSSFPNVYAVTRAADASPPTLTSVLVSVAADGSPGDGYRPAISDDGRYIAFVTDALNMTDAVDLPGETSCLFESQGGFDFAPVHPQRAPALAAPTPTDTPAPTDTPTDVPTPTDTATPTPTDTGPPPPAARIACQVVERDLEADGAALAPGGAKPGPAQLASPSQNLNCGNQATVCNADGDSDGPLTVSAHGGQVSFESLADDLAQAADPDPTCCLPQNVYVRTWTPQLTADPVSFGSVDVGTSVTQPITLTVTGFGPFEIGELTAGPAANGFSIDSPTDGCSGHTLHDPPGSPPDARTCQAGVTFSPQQAGPQEGAVTVPMGEDANGTPAQNFPISGNGTAPSTSPTPTPTPTPTSTESSPPPQQPGLSADPSSVDFGNHLPLDKPAKKTVTITNTGAGPLKISSGEVVDTSQPGASVDYTVDLGTCASPVAAAATCTLTLSFVGHAVGVRDAVLVLHDNRPGGSSLIAVLANVPRPTVLANPGVSPPGRVTQISGTGFAPGLPVDIALTGSFEKATAVADAHGAFSTPLVLFPHGALGPRTITAHTHDKSPTISAEGPFLVALGSVEEPQLGTRH